MAAAAAAALAPGKAAPAKTTTPADDKEEMVGAEGTDTAAEGAEGAEGKKRGKFKLSRKKLMIFGGAALFLVIAGVGAVAMGVPAMLLGGEPAADEAAVVEEETVGVFYDLPEMLVNLSSNGKKLGFLKLRVALELKDPEAQARIEAVLPRIIDNFQTYLRGLRMEDLNGSAGLYRLREELLLRVSAAVKPVEVKDVLFKEMLVQ